MQHMRSGALQVFLLLMLHLCGVPLWMRVGLQGSLATLRLMLYQAGRSAAACSASARPHHAVTIQ